MCSREETDKSYTQSETLQNPASVLHFILHHLINISLLPLWNHQCYYKRKRPFLVNRKSRLRDGRDRPSIPSFSHYPSTTLCCTLSCTAQHHSQTSMPTNFYRPFSWDFALTWDFLPPLFVGIEDIPITLTRKLSQEPLPGHKQERRRIPLFASESSTLSCTSSGSSSKWLPGPP